jgi:hypothetical protein
MPNRAQRRANARRKNDMNGERRASDQGLFEAKADAVAEGRKGVWRPSRVEPVEQVRHELTPQEKDAQAKVSARTTGWGIAKLISWLLIVLSSLAFLILMWIPGLPMWAILTVTIVFGLGVLSLFIVRSPHDVNPYLDANGTAV